MPQLVHLSLRSYITLCNPLFLRKKKRLLIPSFFRARLCDRHFAIVDPNGIGIDIVTYSAPE